MKELIREAERAEVIITMVRHDDNGNLRGQLITALISFLVTSALVISLHEGISVSSNHRGDCCYSTLGRQREEKRRERERVL